jgi:membrane-associated phospholipid phosphatase
MKINNLYLVPLLIINIYILLFPEIVSDSIQVQPLYKEYLLWSTIPAFIVGSSILDKIESKGIVQLRANDTTKTYHENTISEAELFGVSGLFALGIFLIPNDYGWMNRVTYLHTRGILFSITSSLFLSQVVKTAVTRDRPCSANYPIEKKSDSNKSFYSGHAAVSFSVATYTSLYSQHFIFTDNNTIDKISKILLSITSYSFASYVSYTRLKDNKHFLSDVFIGAIAGTSVSALTYYFSEKYLTLHSKPKCKQNISLNYDYNSKNIYVMYAF